MNDFNQQLKDEIRFLNRNELIDIRDIILKYDTVDVFYPCSNGLRIDLNKLTIECKRDIKKYIENLYYELNEHRKQFCSKDVNTTEFKFIDF